MPFVPTDNGLPFFAFDAPLQHSPTDWIPGFLPGYGSTLLIGAQEVGKTTIALEICESLLTGRKLFGSLEPTRQATRILYMLWEHDQPTLWGIKQRLQFAHPDIAAIMAHDQGLILSSFGRHIPKVIDELTEFVKVHDIDFIVGDPWFGGMYGDENDAQHTRQYGNAWRQVLSKVSNCTLLGIHHPGKDFFTKEGKVVKRREARGSSAIEQAATHVWFVESIAEDRIKLSVRKYKGADRPSKPYLLGYDPSPTSDAHHRLLLGPTGGKEELAREHLDGQHLQTLSDCPLCQ